MGETWVTITEKACGSRLMYMGEAKGLCLLLLVMAPSNVSVWDVGVAIFRKGKREPLSVVFF